MDISNRTRLDYLFFWDIFDPVGEILDEADRTIDERGLSAMLPGPAGDRARPRRHEIAAALNRLRSLEIG